MSAMGQRRTFRAIAIYVRYRRLSLTTTEFDEVMDHVGRAYGWLERCERLDEMLFDLQQDLRAEERTMHQRNEKRKTVMV